MFLLPEEPGFGTKPALIDPEGGLELNYEELATAVGRLRDEFSAQVGALVFLFSDPCLETVIAYLGAVEAGLTVAMIDSGTQATSLARLLDLYRPEGVLGPQQLRRMLESRDYRFRAGAAFAPLFCAWREGSEECQSIRAEEAVLLSTSGSTGSPKFVRLSRHNIESNARSIITALGITPADRAISSLPLSYSFGLSVLNSHLLAGASVVLSRKSLVEKEFWEHFTSTGCTSLSGVPYTYQLLRRLRFERMSLPRLRAMTQAGGKLDVESIQFFSELLASRGAGFHVMYGQTEATARISCLPPELLPRKLGSVGTAIPGGLLEILSEDGRICPPDTIGEIVYSGPNVMLGYARRREDLGRGDALQGRLQTGDLGTLDEEGYLRVTGRKSRFAKILGLRVDLDEVEEAAGAPAIPCAAVDAGSKIILFLEGASDRDRSRCSKHLLSRINIEASALELRPIKELPRTPRAKIDYRELKSWI